LHLTLRELLDAPYFYALIILAGMAAGFINVLAGNGSLITLPILMVVKVAMVLALALVSLIVFQLNSQVDWSVGVVLGVGNMIGAWLATRFAIDKGASGCAGS
jgi:uncharacterized protein